MIINGLNKLTLLDYPGLTACTIYVCGCNFRCPFCHNAGLVTDCGSQPELSEEEVFAFLKKRQGVLDGVCITGGEPTLAKGLEEFILKVKELGYKVKLDTNGSNPDVLRRLLSKVDYVAMDIKNSLSRYPETVGIAGFNTAAVEESVQLLKDWGKDCEFRTTVVKELHDERSFADIAGWLKGGRAYYLQQFVDSGNLIGSGLHPHDKERLYGFLNIIRPYFEICGIRGTD